MHHRWFIFVDFSACLEQLAVQATAGSPGQQMIGVLAGSQDLNLDSSLLNGFHYFLARAAIRQKVGRSNVDAGPSRRE